MSNEIVQLFTNPVGLPLPLQQADADNYDAEAELRCPNCECAIPVAETCVYCNFDLISWAISMQQSSAIQRISETMQEMRNGGY